MSLFLVPFLICTFAANLDYYASITNCYSYCGSGICAARCRGDFEKRPLLPLATHRSKPQNEGERYPLCHIARQRGKT